MPIALKLNLNILNDKMISNLFRNPFEAFNN